MDLITGRIFNLFALVCAAAAVLSISPEQAAAQGLSAEPRVRAKVFADVGSIQAGQTFHLAVAFEIQPHWHTYWVFPGDSGLATTVTVLGPEEFQVGPILWPRPETIHTPEGVTYGYENQVVHFVPITAPTAISEEHHAKGKVEFNVQVRWLACKETCVLESHRETISLPIGEAEYRLTQAQLQLLETYRQRLPRPIEELDDHHYTFDGHTLTVAGVAGEYDAIELFPKEMPGVTFGAAKIEIQDGRYRVEVPVELNSRNALGKEMEVSAVIGLGRSADGPTMSIRFKPGDGMK